MGTIKFVKPQLLCLVAVLCTQVCAQNINADCEAPSDCPGRPDAELDDRLIAGRDVFLPDQCQKVEQYLLEMQQNANQHYRHDSHEWMRLLTMYHSMFYADIFIDNYASYTDIAVSGGPKVSSKACEAQLTLWLNEHAQRRLNVSLPAMTPTGAFETRAPMADYQACLASGGRFCWAKMTIDGHNGRLSRIFTYKRGLCLPSACDSINLKNKYDLVERLMYHEKPKLNNFRSLELADVYCLPDEQSPLTKWWLSSTSLAWVSLASLWLALQAIATYRHHRHGAGSLFASFCEALSISRNLKQLTSMESRSHEDGHRKAIDFDVLAGIKVLSSCYVTSGHVLMAMTISIGNMLALSQEKSLMYQLTNMMPAFAVNIFFTLTGIMTAYFVFKQSVAARMLTTPWKWLAVCAVRYLRIMPVYALVVVYAKHLAKYAGSGPFWDYATAVTSQRRICEQESWVWSLSMTANFKSPVEHCVPGAWYLANDFQFLLVAPIFLYALAKSERVGKLLLYLTISLGYAAGFWSIISLDSSFDLKPTAQFLAHGFKTYVSLLSNNYTMPLYRIPAYLVGILYGYKLHQYEIAQNPAGEEKRHCRWSPKFVKFANTGTLTVIVLWFITPYVGALLPYNKLTAKLMIAFVMPTYHLVIAVTFGAYMLVAVTDSQGTSSVRWLLSRPLWKPLSRLCLCVLLINIEVINYLVQSPKQWLYMTGWGHFWLNMVCLWWTYVIASLVHVLFELPIKSLLDLALTSMRSKNKATRQHSL